MRHVEEQTDGRMRLGPGTTLYSSIQALLEETLIEEVDRPKDSDAGRERRRYYWLASAGRKLARAEAERLVGILRVARAKKLLRGGLFLKRSMGGCYGFTPGDFVRSGRGRDAVVSRPRA